MSAKINLMLLYGGKSGEHEISLVSAQAVLKHLNPARYHIMPVGMTKEGHLYLNDYQTLLTYTEALPVKTAQSRHLSSLVEDGSLVLNTDVVWPMVHGRLYEDGCLQGLLELANVAYVGCDVMASAMGMDKDFARRVACVDGLLSAPYKVLNHTLSAQDQQHICKLAVAQFGWPLFVKPCSSGSSVGIHKVHNLDELAYAVADAFKFDHTILIEQAVKGRELEVAILDNTADIAHPLVSCVGEVVVTHQDGFYSYSAKYIDHQTTELVIPAVGSKIMMQAVQDAALAVFKRLRCRGMARVDFFFDEQTQTLYFNEINTLPGFTPMSMFPLLWQAKNMDYAHLLDELIQLAQMYHQKRQQLITHYS
ncbi:MAG TPA: D-alanine--D-alanine ligase [Legionellales bacterium]|nr:D-alanine--D-alanine ligase [Legionellales bacterium]HCA89499.1 D-alanine--D-alanine ligase [Legionellales bacterium]|tara:strand:- start:2126 stop:3220 length:1095 start_codon:yes stop_codon:yes gene_type:complete